MKNNTRLLISGGAGYIGSVLSHHLKKNSIPFIILDYKKKVDPNFFPKKSILYRGDISNQILLEKIYTEFKPTHIVHLAAKISVMESEQNKAEYKLNNIIKSKIFISFFIRKKIKNFLFSSSAAVYSNNINVKKETVKEKPANYYGKTKLDLENYLLQQKKKYNLNIVILRFFNVVGAHDKLRSGNSSCSSKNLFSSICRSILKKKIFNINSNNKNNLLTKDGTAIRDFINVNDIAKIIITIVKKKFIKYDVLNIGSGIGYTVLEIIRLFEKNLKKKLNIKFLKNNKAGASNVVSNSEMIKKIYTNKLTSINASIISHYKFYNKKFK
jgi:UDP-glucose 4-epimerase